MTSEFQNNQNFNQTSEAELPQSGVNASDRVKEYGKKSFAPFIDVLHKYQGEITPYFSALDKALQGAINALKNESGQGTEAEKMVSEWFSEASQWFNQAKSKFEATDSNALMNYLQEQGRNKPAVMFATSY